MSNARFIEVNSTYRDIKLWPLAGEFEIPISQTGTKIIGTAVDPVSLAAPIFSWTGNNLAFVTGDIDGIIALPSPPNNLGCCSDYISLIILTPSPIQQLRNYYDGLVLAVLTTTNNIVVRRIATSYYLGIDTNGNSRMQINVTNTFPDIVNYNDKIEILDPTDLTDPNNPLIFIPLGAPQENAFNNYILYDETVNQYRPILHYDNITGIAQLDTTKSAISNNTSGPISGWSTTDNFSLRVQPPTLPLLGTTGYPLVVIMSTLSVVTVQSVLLSDVTDYYKYSFLRILPYNGSGNYKYNYNPTTTNNKSACIVSYSYDTVTNVGTFILSPGFDTIPIVGSPIEILPFSHDNFNPFIYTGSLSSQQDMVCYEVQLVNLSLPNAVLSVAQGGRIAYYPYIYVQISNVSSSGSGLKNIIYSNNPNATNVIFRAPIYDVQDPLNTPFVRIDAGNMIQTIKFKPNDNLYFKVSLSTGETYNTILEEFYSPIAPNPRAQITAVFGIRRSAT